MLIWNTVGKLWEEMSSAEKATPVLQRTPALKHEPGNDRGLQYSNRSATLKTT
jgi:hypothetical protein